MSSQPPQNTDNLNELFHPQNVAVIGASTTFGKWGQMIFSNIAAGGFKGKIIPVNTRGGKMFGRTAFTDIEEISDPVQLAFITTPAKTVPGIVRKLGKKRVTGAVVISSGFSETDASGKALEKELVQTAGESNVRVIGPNTMGIIRPCADLFATGSHPRPRKGTVAFISQSGNLGNQLIHWAQQQGVGISLFVGSGNEAMFTCAHYLEYLAHDPHTQNVVLYLENVLDGARFMRTLRTLNQKKPVIVLKGGRTPAGIKAASSHTGAMGGNDAIFEASCRQTGIVTARVPSDLLSLSAGFSELPLPNGNRVGIVTLGGGWGVVTADVCMHNGLAIPELPQGLIETIGRYLPEFWSRGNPVDLVGTRNLDAPVVAVEELMKSDGIDAVICLGIIGRQELVRQLLDSTGKADPIVTPEFLARVDEKGAAYEADFIAALTRFMEKYRKPVIGVSMAGTEKGTVRPVEGSRYSAVVYQTPETAVNVLAKMVAYSRYISG